MHVLLIHVLLTSHKWLIYFDLFGHQEWHKEKMYCLVNNKWLYLVRTY